MIKEKYITRVKETSVNVVQSKIEAVRKKDIVKTSLRVYRDGYIGYAGVIGKYDEKALEERAKQELENKISYNYELGGKLSIKEDFSTEIIMEHELLEEFEELVNLVRQEQPEFYFSNKINLKEIDYKMLNDNGLDLTYGDKAIELNLIFKEKSSTSIMDGKVVFCGRSYNRKQAISNINEICNAYRNKVDLPAKQSLPVVFYSSNPLPLKKLLQDLNGNSFGIQSSLLSNKTEEKVFNESFTLYQTNNPNDTALVPFFDAEGSVNYNYRYALIEEGTVISPYTDKKTASKYMLPLTGCAASQYDGIPALGVPNLKIKESQQTAKELLGGEMGILVVIASGGDFTPQGNFATPVQLSFLFDGENIIGRLPELNLSSSVFDMYGDSFIGISRDTVSPLSNDRFLIMNMNVSKL